MALDRLCSIVAEVAIHCTIVRRCLLVKICPLEDTTDYHKLADLVKVVSHYYRLRKKVLPPRFSIALYSM